MLKLSEDLRSDNLNKIIKALDNENISYQLRGNRNPNIIVNNKDLKRASEISREVVPKLKSMMPTDKDYITISSKVAR